MSDENIDLVVKKAIAKICELETDQVESDSRLEEDLNLSLIVLPSLLGTIDRQLHPPEDEQNTSGTKKIGFFKAYRMVSDIQRKWAEEYGDVCKELKTVGEVIAYFHVPPQDRPKFFRELKAYHRDEPVRCPRCGSNQLTASQKGFGLGKAVTGAAVLGGIGLLGGFVGSHKVQITCLKCGNSWEAGG